MLMAAVLKAHNEARRKVWVVDSFEGCPPPDADTFPQVLFFFSRTFPLPTLTPSRG